MEANRFGLTGKDTRVKGLKSEAKKRALMMTMQREIDFF
jgi:hypothetical protein